MLEFVNKYGGDIHSQNGEDLILRECLRRMKIETGFCVEIGGNNGIWMSNTAALLQRGWSGLFVEADFGLWQQCRDTWKQRPDVRCACSRVDASNVNAFVDEKCDLLSMDTDGQDYQIFKGLKAKPKIVIVEIDSGIPPERGEFNSDGGAGYAPMVELGMQKGYRLLCHTGNLIFIDKQFKHLFPEIKGHHPTIEPELYFQSGVVKGGMRGYCTMLALGNYGRFANGAYQVAGVLGVARRNGLTPVFPTWENKDHRDSFGSSEDVDIYKHLVNPLPSIPEGVAFQDRVVEWGYHDVDLPVGNWNISGHFQSSRYFEHCLDECRWQLRMKDEPRQNDYCAIHVRLTDYDNAYHPRLGMDYYAPAMAEFPGEKFLVFSDDIQSAKTMFGDAVGYSEGRDYLADFKLMKKCRHFIIGNSSFSAMAAVLGEAKDKRVIAPRPWFGQQYAGITGEDIYNSDWTVINWKQAA